MPNYPTSPLPPYTQPKPTGRPLPNPVIPTPQPMPSPVAPNPFQRSTPQPVNPGAGTPGRSPAVLPSTPPTSRPIDIEPK